MSSEPIQWLPAGETHPAEELRDDEIHLWLLERGRGDPAVRALIARYAGVEPAELKFAHGAHGKPRVPDVALTFNLSHTGSHTLLACARGCELGVDLEHERRIRRRAALLERCFTEREQARMRADGPGEAALLRHWAAKEALVKAIGRGIAYGLKRIAIAFDGSHPRVVELDGEAGPPGRWQLAGFEPLPGAYAALAYEGTPRSLRGFLA